MLVASPRNHRYLQFEVAGLRRPSRAPCGGCQDDGVDEAADGFSGFGPRVGMLERLREAGHLLPVELGHSRMQERRWLVG
jgi:hypothetical protein